MKCQAPYCRNEIETLRMESCGPRCVTCCTNCSKEYIRELRRINSQKRRKKLKRQKLAAMCLALAIAQGCALAPMPREKPCGEPMRYPGGNCWSLEQKDCLEKLGLADDLWLCPREEEG